MPFSNLSNISNLMVPPTTTMSAHVEAANPHPMYLLTSSLIDAVSAKITVDCLNDVHVEDVSMLDSTVLFHSAGVWQPLPVATLLSGVRVGYATTVESGVVRLATYNDISVKNSIAAVTPNLLVDYVSEALVPVNSTISSIQYTVDHLSTPYATTDASGVVKLAVYPDIAGNNSSTVITPNLLKEYVTSSVLNFSGNLEIPTVTNATTTENGIVRLATLDDVSNTNLTIEDPIAVTPPILDAYVQTSVSTINNNIALKQDKLSAGTGIEIVSMSNGTPVYPQVINCTVSYHPGTGINIDENNSINCTVTSKEYHPGSNIDIDSNDSIHCTYAPPDATTTIAGIVKLIDSLPCNDSDLHTAAVTPGALTNNTIIGVINETWRPVRNGYYSLNRGDATNTDGCLKFPFLRLGSLCLAMAWGRTDLIRNEKTCMYDIDIRSVGQDKLFDVITVNINTEAYGGPEAYVRSKSGNMSGDISYGGMNYDRNSAKYFTSADATTSSVSNMISGVHFIVDPNDTTSPYTPINSTRINITGRGEAEYQIGSKNNQQYFEVDNAVIQYAGAIHASRVNSYGTGPFTKEIESISNPVTHLRTILNHINTDNRHTWFYAHWFVLGLTTISESIWQENEIPQPVYHSGSKSTSIVYQISSAVVPTNVYRYTGEQLFAALDANHGDNMVAQGRNNDLIPVFNASAVSSGDMISYEVTNYPNSRASCYAYAIINYRISRFLADDWSTYNGTYRCPGLTIQAVAWTGNGYHTAARIDFTSDTVIDMKTNKIRNVRVTANPNDVLTNSSLSAYLANSAHITSIDIGAGYACPQAIDPLYYFTSGRNPGLIAGTDVGEKAFCLTDNGQRDGQNGTHVYAWASWAGSWISLRFLAFAYKTARGTVTATMTYTNPSKIKPTFYYRASSRVVEVESE